MSYGALHILPLYHPAAVIYNQSLKEVLKEDFKTLKKFEKEAARPAKGNGKKDDEKPAQQPLL